MNASMRNLLCAVLLTGTLAACGSKPADTAASGSAATGAPAAASTAAAAGTYHGVPIYPGMTELTTADHAAGPDMVLHSGNYRSSDKQEQILAFYRENLGKLFGAAPTEGSMGEGIVGFNAGNETMHVTVLVHTGDPGEQIVGIQVGSKD
jgi:hypothetical protein